MSIISLTGIIYSIYLLTSILAPIQTIEITSQFLSLLAKETSTHQWTKCITLFLNFITSLSILGLQVILDIVQAYKLANTPQPLTISNEQESFNNEPAATESNMRVSADFTPSSPSIDKTDETESTPMPASKEDTNSDLTIDEAAHPVDIEEVCIHSDAKISVLEQSSHEETHTILSNAVDNEIPDVKPLEDDTIDTPDLTPPNQSTSSIASLSRQSSRASHRSQFKKNFQAALHKMSGKHHSLVSTDSVLDTSSISNTSGDLFSSSINKKKSKDSLDIFSQPDIKPKKSSNKFQKGLKSTSRKLSKMFA